MKKTGSFRDGYIDGYQSIRGEEIVPEIPSFSVPPRQTPYQHGYECGKTAAEKFVDRKPSH
jgi:hypothetical protein